MQGTAILTVQVISYAPFSEDITISDIAMNLPYQSKIIKPQTRLDIKELSTSF